MFLHFGKTSAIIAQTLAKEPIMKTTQKKSTRPKARPSKAFQGGKVTGYKNGGCVMSGRGGKYKGMK
jgi:hypothetical protein